MKSGRGPETPFSTLLPPPPSKTRANGARLGPLALGFSPPNHKQLPTALWLDEEIR